MANMQSMNRTEALRLADALSQGRYLTTDAGNPIAEAAAELRRLHAELAQLREKRQPLSDEQIDALPIVIHLRERIKHWKRESAKRYVEGWNDSAEQEGVSNAD